MGCWSENCAISGIEIRPGTPCYRAHMIRDKYYESQWEFIIPPILGKYDDYGGLDDPEKSIIWPYEDYDYWPDTITINGKAVYEKPLPIYFHAEVFDLLENVPLEWKRDGAQTVGDMATEHINKMMGFLEKKKEAIQSKDLSKMVLAMSEESRFQMMDDFRGKLFVSIENKVFENDENLKEFLKLYRRCFVAHCGMRELRKNLMPGARGPQHCGEEAMRYFLDGFGKIFSAHEARIKKDYE